MPEKKYYKNHPVPIIQRVPEADRAAENWAEHDPRDHDDCSLFAFND